MIDGLALAVIVSALAQAIWAFVACARNLRPTRALFVGIVVLGGIVAVLVVVAVVRLLSGAGPHEGGRLVTFVGYLLTALLLPPAGLVLARLEPTRWGSGLIGAAAVMVPVVVLRLQQVWGG